MLDGTYIKLDLALTDGFDIWNFRMLVAFEDGISFLECATFRLDPVVRLSSHQLNVQTQDICGLTIRPTITMSQLPFTMYIFHLHDRCQHINNVCLTPRSRKAGL